MKIVLRSALIAVAMGTVPFMSAQKTTSAHPKHAVVRRKTATLSSLAEQMQQMHDDFQSQINSLKQQLSERDAQLASMQQSNQQQTSVTAAQTQSVATAVEQNTSAVNTLQAKVEAIHTTDAVVTAKVEEVQKNQESLRKAVDEPASIHYKGITIVPGGFLAAESVWRQRAMNADVYTNYNATPYPSAGEAHTSEWVPTARQSRLSFLASGKVPFGTVSGYFEGDFLSAAVTSNNLQTNSYTLRIRQAWGQAQAGRTTFTGGEMWTLLTEDKKAASPGQEALPLFFDANTHVGFTYARQAGFRVQEAFTPSFTLAVAVENSQYQFAASNAASNFFFGSAGAAGGLNNSSANYTNQVAPDVVIKASFDPKHGHYEIGGIARFFRDRYYPVTGSSSNAQNDTKLGGGFVANARFPIGSKTTVGLHVVAGDGTGRYGASLLPDITVHPNGTLEPLRNAQGMFSLEVHPTPRLDLFAYAGAEYVQRTTYLNAAGVLVGYAPVSGSNIGCGVEAVPTGSTGYAPGTGACLGATRDITQGSVGYQYRIYSGPKGRLQYGLAYSYLTRSGWTGVGGAPKATNNFVYTSFRYYIP
jgi:TolA-binding protein